MSSNLLSDAELVKRTSRLVAAHCRSLRMDTNGLPHLIASVAAGLRARLTVVEKAPR
jgi:predicted transcriptional regulator